MVDRYNAVCFKFIFFNDTATTEIYTLSLHDALPICGAAPRARTWRGCNCSCGTRASPWRSTGISGPAPRPPSCASSSSARSEEHTSELQSRQYLVCRLLLEKKKTTLYISTHTDILGR